MSKFKVGDKVRIVASKGQLRCHSCHPDIEPGEIYTVASLENSGSYGLKEFKKQRFVRPDFVDNVIIHPHHDIIIAWLNGKEVQRRGNLSEKWLSITSCANTVQDGYSLPGFCKRDSFRIKPEESPAELELKKLQKQINELTEQAEKLAKEIKGEN